MAERQDWPDEVKGAVMAALLTGQSVASVARAYQSRSSVGVRFCSMLHPPGNGEFCSVAFHKNSQVAKDLIN